ncbi:unnamed protein product [Microthlaspi erraticum]|uniref:WW domain-containing protein n=1 Tax=Microthlaspi erraticum TaxID=1685480 RepID=A0A6D2I3G9_9BRAS|nr:unnamed protein product [Microthlaspi erraticum]
MEGYATKVPELNNCDAAQIRKSRIVSRIYVEGYDTSRSGYDFVNSMREHFSSCGEVMHVYIPGYTGYIPGTTLNRFSLIYLRGEGAEEKALKLSGSYSGRGHKLVVEPYPFHAKHLDHKFAPTRYEDNIQHHTILVGGYDTRLPLEHVERYLYEQLSKCGRVMIAICEDGQGFVYSNAYVTLVGIDAVEKLLQLSGSDEEGWESLKFSRFDCPDRDGEAGACNMRPDCPLDPYSSYSTPVMALASLAPEDPNLPKPPCMTSLLPRPWIYRKVSGTGCGCILNTETGDEVEVPPSLLEPASRICYAPEDPNLPKPWKGLVDISTGYGYFWNTETNVTQYEIPYSSASLLGLIHSSVYQRKFLHG